VLKFYGLTSLGQKTWPKAVREGDGSESSEEEFEEEDAEEEDYDLLEIGRFWIIPFYTMIPYAAAAAAGDGGGGGGGHRHEVIMKWLTDLSFLLFFFLVQV